MFIIFLGLLSDSEQVLVDQIFKETHVKFFNISFQILRSRTDAEEAVSEAFLKIINHISKIGELSCHERISYCVIIVKNESINLLRKQKREVSIEDIQSCDDEDFLFANDELSYVVEKESLQRAMNMLTKDEKYLIRLRFFRNLSYKSIQEIIGGNEDAIRKRCQRVINKLQALYGEGEKNVKHV